MVERAINHDVEFLFRETKILKDRDPIGIGAYGEVRYAKCDSLLCAAKCIQDLFHEEYQLDPNNVAVIEAFKREYAYLSNMKHPNIVQYLGYYNDHSDNNKTYLLMELMDESLDNYLEKLEGPVPFHKALDFTHDIAMGLDYLHYNGIMHCDLSAKNVLLLSGSRAKISDFGQSVLVSAETGYRVRGNQAPGTVYYMPPEALNEDRPEFGSQIDVFSLGVLMIQIMTRQWPDPSESTTTIKGDGPGSPDIVLPVKELVRRGSHLSMINHRHPLYQLAIFCIKDDENERPTVMEVCNRLSEFKEIEPEYKRSRLENPHDPVRRSIASDREVDELKKQIKELQENNHMLRDNVVQMQFHIDKQAHIIASSGVTPSTDPPSPMPIPIPNPEPQNSSLTSAPPLPVQDMVLANKRWKWYPCKRTPVPLYGGSAVTIGERIYVTGQALKLIYEFDPNTSTWEALPAPPNASFALVSISGVLTTVGGFDEQSYSNCLYSLVKDQGPNMSWKQMYPQMKDSRVSPCATSNERYVVVAGGDQQVPGNRLLGNSVEIMDIQSRTWTVADRLPKPLKRGTLTVSGDHLYIVGGVTVRDQPISEMFFASLPNLVSSAARRNLAGDLNRAFKFDKCWQSTSVPCVYGTCTTLGRYIVLVGGWSNKLSDAVYLFDPQSQTGGVPWRYAGPLFKGRMDSMVAVLPGQRMVVVGGRSHSQKEPVLSDAEVACPV